MSKIIRFSSGKAQVIDLITGERQVFDTKELAEDFIKNSYIELEKIVKPVWDEKEDVMEDPFDFTHGDDLTL